MASPTETTVEFGKGRVHVASARLSGVAVLDRSFGYAIPSEQLGKLVPPSGGAPKTGSRVGTSSRSHFERSPFGFGPGGRSSFVRVRYAVINDSSVGSLCASYL